MGSAAVSVSGKVIEVVKLVYAIIAVSVAGAVFFIGLNWKTEQAIAMSIETKTDLAALRLDREKTLHEYYSNIATINTTLDSMQRQMNRIENKMDK